MRRSEILHAQAIGARSMCGKIARMFAQQQFVTCKSCIRYLELEAARIMNAPHIAKPFVYQPRSTQPPTTPEGWTSLGLVIPFYDGQCEVELESNQWHDQRRCRMPARIAHPSGWGLCIRHARLLIPIGDHADPEEVEKRIDRWVHGFDRGAATFRFGNGVLTSKIAPDPRMFDF